VNYRGRHGARIRQKARVTCVSRPSSDGNPAPHARFFQGFSRILFVTVVNVIFSEPAFLTAAVGDMAGNRPLEHLEPQVRCNGQAECRGASAQ
jgi:hypothetical protein